MIAERTITTPTGRVIHVNYPTPEVHDITPMPLVMEVTRMDFIILEGGVTVNKLGQGIGKMVVIEGKTMPGFDLDAALTWCRSHGWTVRRWPGGARAWKNGLEPVRTQREILKLREKLSNNPRPELEGQGVNLDLAYDL